jgi:hypothetical protein
MQDPEDRYLQANMLIVGIPGSGKSYYFKNEVMPELLKDGRRIIILDWKNEYNYPARVSLNTLTGPVMLGEIMNGVYSKGRKPHVLRITSHDYNIEKIDHVIFQYLCNCRPTIFVCDEGHFLMEELIHKQLPYWMKRYFRTAIGTHNRDQNIVLLTQFTRDCPSKVLNIFQDGRIFYTPKKELYYLYENRVLEEDPEEVYTIIHPYKSFKYYDLGAYLAGLPQPCDEIEMDVEITEERMVQSEADTQDSQKDDGTLDHKKKNLKNEAEA